MSGIRVQNARRLILVLAPVITGLFAIGSARADIVFDNPNGSGSNTGYDNILYNGGADITSGNIIRGHTQADGYLLDFQAAESLLIQGGGQAQIAAADGQFEKLLVSLASGGTFTQLKFILESAADGNVKLEVTEGNGQISSAVFGMLQNGTNWYTTVAINGEDIRTVSIDSSGVNGAPINDIQQVRIGGVSEVPEPGAVALLGSVIFVLAASQRKRFAKR